MVGTLDSVFQSLGSLQRMLGRIQSHGGDSGTSQYLKSQ